VEAAAQPRCVRNSRRCIGISQARSGSRACRYRLGYGVVPRRQPAFGGSKPEGTLPQASRPGERGRGNLQRVAQRTASAPDREARAGQEVSQGAAQACSDKPSVQRPSGGELLRRCASGAALYDCLADGKTSERRPISKPVLKATTQMLHTPSRSWSVRDGGHDQATSGLA
jgi:hypothetical protein